MFAKMFAKLNEVGFPFAWGQNPDQSFQSDPFLLVKVFFSISFSVTIWLLHGSPWLLFFSKLKQTKFWLMELFFFDTPTKPPGGLRGGATAPVTSLASELLPYTWLYMLLT